MSDAALDDDVDVMGSALRVGRRAADVEVAGLKAWATGHERLCTERWGDTKFRLRRIEACIIGAVVAFIGGLWWATQWLVDHMSAQVIEQLAHRALQ